MCTSKLDRRQAERDAVSTCTHFFASVSYSRWKINVVDKIHMDLHKTLKWRSSEEGPTNSLLTKQFEIKRDLRSAQLLSEIGCPNSRLMTSTVRPATAVESVASGLVRSTLKDNGIRLNSTVLGKGSYSTVLLGYSSRLGRSVAVKKIDRRVSSEYVRRFLPREMDLVLQLDHFNILKVYSIVQTDSHVCLVEEFAGNGDLLKLIQQRRRIDESDARPLFRHLIAGLEADECSRYLETKSVVHRDLKCENLMLDQYNNLKIGDFGFARFLQSAYVALEISRSRAYRDNAVDIWSAGVILYIMLTGVMPYDERHPKEMMQQQREHKLRFYHHSRPSQSARDLIYAMIHPDPARRVNIPGILQSEWLRNTPYEKYGPQMSEDEDAETANQISEGQYRAFGFYR
ncbi:Testis-specific serine/threonine-protein kinase 2 [Aphelenchoides besseyi]|nr:Testis-specific serine/threonine-protein kinase 2 [Aphelenchoides besseyi]